MNAHTTPQADERPFVEAFEELPDRAALRLLKRLAQRFSGLSYGFDKIDHGIDLIAIDLAEDEGWRGDDLADRYLSNPDRFGPAFERAPMVPISGASWHAGGRFGG
jgi:hypothetical protein